MKRGRFTKNLIQYIVWANILFTIAVFCVFVITGNEPSALIVAWFTFWGSELWNMQKIKNTKIKEGLEDVG